MIRFVTIHTFSNPFEAEVVKGRLEAEGIKAHILDQNVSYTIGPTILQGYRLQVHQENVLKALNILEKTLPKS